MPCSNHPEVLDGLDTCARCGKSFCIDCLVGRKAGWFCKACDAAIAPPPAAPPPTAPQPIAEPRRPAVPSGRACTNHPEVVDRVSPCTRCRKNFCPDCLVELKGGRFCAGCKSEALKDLQSGVDQTQLPLAHLGRRFVALFIDGIIVGLAFIPFFVIMAATQGASAQASGPGAELGGLGMQLIFQAVAWVVPMAYKALMIQKFGQTVGKMAMGIKVVNPDGSAVAPGQAWLRAFIEMLLAGCCYVTYIVAFFNKDKCALHDMAAKTRVIKL